MGGRDIILWVFGVALATALTVFGAIKAVNWLVPSEPYGKTMQMPKAK
jgi:hypothetical protein